MNRYWPAVPETLYHYSCLEHGHPAIFGSGRLKTGRDGLVWLTDLPEPNRGALGLTRVSLECDRGAVRYRVDDTSTAVSWMEFRQNVPGDLRDLLETFPDAMPRHWFVTWQDVAAVYDPIQRGTP